MNSLDAADKEVGMPEDEIVLARCHHPTLHTGHPTFSRLPVHAQWALVALEKQDAKWGHMPYFKSRGGSANTKIAILNGYHKSERLLNCMMVPNQYSAFSPYGRCGLPMCPFCQYLKGQDLLKKYGPAWETGCWHWLVFSIAGYVNLSACRTDEVLGLGEAVLSCLRRWKSSLEGCAAWEELAVPSFLPEPLCTPHVNVLVRQSGDLDLDLLAQIIAEEWQAFGLSALPDLKMEAPRSEAHFYRLLEYVKPTDLLTAYKTGFRAAKNTGDLERLHEAVRHFFDGYAEIITEYRNFWDKRFRRYELRPYARIPHFYYGKCHGSAAAPLGTNRQQRRTKEHQDFIRTGVLNANEDEMAQAIAQENQTGDQPEDL